MITREQILHELASASTEADEWGDSGHGRKMRARADMASLALRGLEATWRPAKDAPAGDALVTLSNGVVLVANRCQGKFGELEWRIAGLGLCNPTHFMPLPSAPEVG